VRAEGVSEYQNEKGWAIVAALDDVAKQHNVPLSAVALAWLRSQPGVSTPIASARTVEQLHEIMQLVELTPENVEQLNKVSA